MPVTTPAPFSLQRTIQVLNDNFAIILIAVLTFAAGFASGSLWTENKLLRSGQGLAPAAQPAAQQGAQQPQAPTIATVDLGHFPIQGDKNAKVAIVEFADLRCPFCKQFFDTTEPQIMKDYVNTGKVQFVFRQFEFLGPSSVVAGNAAECANDQGKFWPFHDYLYKNQPSETDTSLYSSDKLTPIAQSLGMNGNTFKNCLDNNKFQKNVDGDKAAGDAAGVTGTPSFVIGKLGSDGKVTGQLVVGALPYASLKTTIDQALGQ